MSAHCLQCGHVLQEVALHCRNTEFSVIFSWVQTVAVDLVSSWYYCGTIGFLVMLAEVDFNATVIACNATSCQVIAFLLPSLLHSTAPLFNARNWLCMFDSLCVNFAFMRVTNSTLNSLVSPANKFKCYTYSFKRLLALPLTHWVLQWCLICCCCP